MQKQLPHTGSSMEDTGSANESGLAAPGEVPPKPERKISALLIVLLTIGILLAACIVFCVGMQYYPILAEKIMASQFTNKPAPDFTLFNLEGQEVTLSRLQGKPVVINFWATWCPSCVDELPDMQAFYSRHENDIHLLAISIDSSESAVQEYAQLNDLQLPILLDPDSEVGALYRVRGIPTTVFIDSEGIVIDRHIGSLNVEQLEDYLETAKKSGNSEGAFHKAGEMSF